jgi:hypothetical protein
VPPRCVLRLLGGRPQGHNREGHREGERSGWTEEMRRRVTVPVAAAVAAQLACPGGWASPLRACPHRGAHAPCRPAHLAPAPRLPHARRCTGPRRAPSRVWRAWCRARRTQWTRRAPCGAALSPSHCSTSSTDSAAPCCTLAHCPKRPSFPPNPASLPPLSLQLTGRAKEGLAGGKAAASEASGRAAQVGGGGGGVEKSCERQERGGWLQGRVGQGREGRVGAADDCGGWRWALRALCPLASPWPAPRLRDSPPMLGMPRHRGADRVLRRPLPSTPVPPPRQTLNQATAGVREQVDVARGAAAEASEGARETLQVGPHRGRGAGGRGREGGPVPLRLACPPFNHARAKPFGPPPPTHAHRTRTSPPRTA